MYEAVSPTFNIPFEEPWFEDTNVGPLDRDKLFPLSSVKISFKVIFDIVTFPLFSTVILYVIKSPWSLLLLPLLSVIVAVLVTSSIGFLTNSTSVLSFSVLPSKSFPSSLMSVTSFVLPGLFALTSKLLITFPESTSFWLIV